MPPEEYLVEGGTNVNDLTDDVLRSQVREGCKRYLEGLEVSKVRDLQAIINFNEANKDIEFDTDFCPNQDGLHKALNARMSSQETERNLQICKQWGGIEGVDKVIATHGVDVIVAPCDSFFAGVGVATQYPLASIHFSYVRSSGRPYGLHVIPRANEEAKIIRFMSMWERTIPPRRVPDLEKLEQALL